jgi:Pyrroline-5-carboxylate reductase
MERIAFIGSGNMATAILGGLIAQGSTPSPSPKPSQSRELR